jgi:hypothetical protein
MKSRILLTLTLLMALVAISQAEYTIWVNPLPLTTSDESMIIETNYSGLGTVKVTTTQAGDYQWVQLGLNLPSTVEIQSVQLCYELMESSSYISQIRIGKMTTPGTALVVYDDPTDLTDIGPTCITSYDTTPLVEATMTLGLRLNSATPGAWYLIGAIGIDVEYEPTGVIDNFNPQITDNLRSVPNPFRDETSFAFDLATPVSRVEMQIHDVSGRRIRSMLLKDVPEGHHKFYWDGRNGNNLPVAAGTYFAKVIADGLAVGTGSVILVH